MCVIRDECVLLVMLLLQLVGGLPMMALMKMCGIAYVALYLFGAVLSVSLTFAPRLRWCCSSFVGFINEFGICLFILTHMALLALSTYTMYMFLLPFFQSNSEESFEQVCLRRKLSDNLSHTGCEKLEGFYALSLVVLTVMNLASAYLLLLGSRITRRNWSDNTRLLKHEIA